MSRIKYATDSAHVQPWTVRIGKVILNFSALEMESYLWAVQMGEHLRVASKFAKLPFAARVERLNTYIDERGFALEWKTRASDAWADARKHAYLRNRVAHNPIGFAWKGTTETGEPDFIGLTDMKASFGEAPPELFSRTDIDSAINEIAALVKRLESLRKEWCTLRDQGELPEKRITVPLAKFTFPKWLKY